MTYQKLHKHTQQAGTHQRARLVRLARVWRSVTVAAGLTAMLGFSALAARQSQATSTNTTQGDDGSTSTLTQPAARQPASALPSQSLFAGEGSDGGQAQSSQPSGTTGSQAPSVPKTRHRTRSSSSH
jgi:hypothetical protein